MPHILVVDDDPHITDVICFALKKAGHTFIIAKTGKEALDIFAQHDFDLIVLDIGLPEIDGLEVCREIRKTSNAPILFLSARDDEIDRILGLEIGGDDYVTKPFSPRELMARITVILKRTQNNQISDFDEKTLTKGNLVLNPEHRSASYKATPLNLTAIEFNILKTVLARPKMAFTRDQIMTAAWPDNIHVSERTIDSHVRNLRSKLADIGCDDAIETVHGIGFRLGQCGIASS